MLKAMEKSLLVQLYVNEKKSVFEIARRERCSQGKINYWLSKYRIAKRSISEAIYTRHNPLGDPFDVKPVNDEKTAFLFGLGIGLYWGEGTKRSVSQVRLGNTDPYLINMFVLFLERAYGVNRKKLKFALQIFTDMDVRRELKFWQEFLDVSSKQFYKTVVTQSGRIGTYREKSKHGVLTVYFNNKKLRDVLVGEIEKMRSLGYYKRVR